MRSRRDELKYQALVNTARGQPRIAVYSQSPKNDFTERFQRDLPCPALLRKIFRFTRRANQWFLSARLTRQEGRLAIVTNARWDAVDADVPLTNGADADGEVVWS
jgi:hypothetical protein